MNCTALLVVFAGVLTFGAGPIRGQNSQTPESQKAIVQVRAKVGFRFDPKIDSRSPFKVAQAVIAEKDTTKSDDPKSEHALPLQRVIKLPTTRGQDGEWVGEAILLLVADPHRDRGLVSAVANGRRLYLVGWRLAPFEERRVNTVFPSLRR